jgi:hypothetical protein
LCDNSPFPGEFEVSPLANGSPDFESKLWAAADALRNNKKASSEDEFVQGLGRIALKDADLNTSSLRASSQVTNYV